MKNKNIVVGDLVSWPQGHLEIPGIVLETRPSKLPKGKAVATMFDHIASINPTGLAVLAMLPELGNDPEWFHECELEKINT